MQMNDYRYELPQEPRLLGRDDLGNPIYEGDDIWVLEDYQFNDHDISTDLIEALKRMGATLDRA